MPVQIFATDVSDAAIEHARAGIYPESIAADVSAERLRRFFNKIDGNYRITKPSATCASSPARTSRATPRSAGST